MGTLTPDIQITGGPWITMEANREATHEEVVNVVAIQQTQELAEVWRKTHHHSSSSAGAACVGGDTPEFAGATRASVRGRQIRFHR